MVTVAPDAAAVICTLAATDGDAVLCVLMSSCDAAGFPVTCTVDTLPSVIPPTSFNEEPNLPYVAVLPIVYGNPARTIEPEAVLCVNALVMIETDQNTMSPILR
jgi:hypothetical protein